LKTDLQFSFSDVHFRYGDGTQALRGIDLEIEAGECIGLAGENGSGKTTLCKQLNGLFHPSSGKVLFKGSDTRSMRVSQLSLRVGYLFQNPDHQIFESTVFDEVAFGVKHLGLSPAEVKERVGRYLSLLDLEQFRKSPPLALSLATRRMVSIASILAMEHEAVVLDEPTAWLDHEKSKRAMDAIREVSDAGRTIIIVTHDMRVIAELVNRMLIMSEGRIVRDGDAKELLSDSDALFRWGLSPPPIARFSKRIFGENLGLRITTNDDFIQMLRSRIGGGGT